MKGWAVFILMGVILCLAFAAIWVRLAPSDPARWHRIPSEVQISDLRNGAMRVVDGGGAALGQLDGVIRGTPRTRILAGSVEEGVITYVTRSAVFGFPDYTTARLRDSQLEIYGRARFGKSDFGVNATRIDGWLVTLAKGG